MAIISMEVANDLVAHSVANILWAWEKDQIDSDDFVDSVSRIFDYPEGMREAYGL